MLNRYKKKRDLFELVITKQVIEMFEHVSFLNVEKKQIVSVLFL